MRMIRIKNKSDSGFSLIEIMVSMSLFITVIVISMGSILSVLDANRKSQSLRAVMDNLNFTLESMTRTIRFGNHYHCGSSGNTSLPLDCASGADSLTLVGPDNASVTYKLVSSRIDRIVDNGVSPQEAFVTSVDVTITKLTFYVFGSAEFNGGADLYQPQVILVISGYAGTKASSQSTFTIETTVSQRLFDFQ